MNRDGRTVLMRAVEANALTSVHYLLGKHANLNLVVHPRSGKEGITCLSLATSDAMALLLIQYGACFPPFSELASIRSFSSLVWALDQLTNDELYHFIKNKNNSRATIIGLLNFNDNATGLPLLRRIFKIENFLVNLKTECGEELFYIAIRANNPGAIKCYGRLIQTYTFRASGQVC